MQWIIWLSGLIILILGDIIFLHFKKRQFQKKLEELDSQRDKEQAESEMMLRETLGNITHDLKTPLTAIRGYSQGILDGVAGTPDRVNKYVTTIRNKADDMAGLVDELSLFAQIYKNDMHYKFTQVDINSYISSCMGNLSLDLETKNIDFLYRSDVPEGTDVYIDTEKVKRVFYNIIGNASKYITTETGLIYVQVEEKENTVWVHIQDNGVGIEKDELPFIFDCFYRTDSSRNSNTGGSGLGLAIARKVIEDHRGQIMAESEKNKGTTISFSLPKKVTKERKCINTNVRTEEKNEKHEKHEKDTDSRR